MILSFIRLRLKEPDLERPYRIRHAGIIGTLALLVIVFFILLYLPGSPSALVWPQEWIIILSWIVLGIVVVFLMRKRFVSREEQAKLILGEALSSSNTILTSGESNDEA